MAPGGFAVREYVFTLPRPALGVLVLDITDPATARVAIEARAGLAPPADADAEPFLEAFAFHAAEGA